MRLIALHHGQRHTSLCVGPLRVHVLWSLWWLRCRLPWWEWKQAGGTWLVRWGPLWASWWRGR
jgi:hypothetical protein